MDHINHPYASSVEQEIRVDEKLLYMVPPNQKNCGLANAILLEVRRKAGGKR